jgi:hypothetical protein
MAAVLVSPAEISGPEASDAVVTDPADQTPNIVS